MEFILQRHIFNICTFQGSMVSFQEFFIFWVTHLLPV